MCNLYSVTKGQSATCDRFRVASDRAGNLPLLPAVFPDQLASIVGVEHARRAGSAQADAGHPEDAR